MLTKKEFKIIDTAFDAGFTDNVGTALRNLFVLGCYLHATGKTLEGKKAIRSALMTTTIYERTDNLFDKIFSNLAGNEKDFAQEIHAHSELLGLLK